MGPLPTLLGGVLGLIAAGGLGLGITHILGPVPNRWRLSTSLVSGAAIIDLAVMLVLFLGSGAAGVKLIGVVATLIGCAVIYALRNHLSFVPGLRTMRSADRWFIGVIVAAAAINLIIATAPSTKIDELYYHMLLPKRVMWDDGLYLYHLPVQLAMFPQTAYQLGLSAAFAAGFPEAGNVLSWGCGVALVLLVAGVTADLTGSVSAGWMTGAISAVGLYPAVWHVTSGPHALGDLATVIATLLALLPDGLGGELKAATRLILVCVAAYVAASTKLSLLPLAAAITLIGAYRVAGQMGWRRAAATVLGVWGTLYGPVLLWTTARCGSPFGVATARVFHSRFFAQEAIAEMWNLQIQEGGRDLLAWLAPSVSIGVLACFAVVFVHAALKREWLFKVLCTLVCGQIILIVWLLPHEFRFLGGLQYVVLILGAWVFWKSRFGERLMARRWMVLLGLCLPWLAVQVYYARPFVKVVSGVESRDAFLRKYAAFTEDFRALDRILPPNAVLYVVNSRLPSYYAPRPVIFTLQDLRGGGPLYRFTVGDMGSEEDSLTCAEPVYVNPDAVSVAYRTPGRPALHDSLKVERCRLTRPLSPDG